MPSPLSIVHDPCGNHRHTTTLGERIRDLDFQGFAVLLFFLQTSRSGPLLLLLALNFLRRGCASDSEEVVMLAALHFDEHLPTFLPDDWQVHGSMWREISRIGLGVLIQVDVQESETALLVQMVHHARFAFEEHHRPYSFDRRIELLASSLTLNIQVRPIVLDTSKQALN